MFSRNGKYFGKCCDRLLPCFTGLPSFPQLPEQQREFRDVRFVFDFGDAAASGWKTISFILPAELKTLTVEKRLPPTSTIFSQARSVPGLVLYLAALAATGTTNRVRRAVLLQLDCKPRFRCTSVKTPTNRSSVR